MEVKNIKRCSFSITVDQEVPLQLKVEFRLMFSQAWRGSLKLEPIW